MISDISAIEALYAAAIIGTPLVLIGVLGLGWLDDWRHHRRRRRADKALRRR